MKSKTWPGFGGFGGFFGRGNNKKAGDVDWMDVSVCVFFWMFGVLMILIGVGWRLVGVCLSCGLLVVLVLKLIVSKYQNFNV